MRPSTQDDGRASVAIEEGSEAERSRTVTAMPIDISISLVLSLISAATYNKRGRVAYHCLLRVSLIRLTGSAMLEREGGRLRGSHAPLGSVPARLIMRAPCGPLPPQFPCLSHDPPCLSCLPGGTRGPMWISAVHVDRLRHAIESVLVPSCWVEVVAFDPSDPLSVLSSARLCSSLLHSGALERHESPMELSLRRHGVCSDSFRPLRRVGWEVGSPRETSCRRAPRPRVGRGQPAPRSR